MSGTGAASPESHARTIRVIGMVVHLGSASPDKLTATVNCGPFEGMKGFDNSNWPGKTFDSGPHPALWHMLDVGAVAGQLLRRGPLGPRSDWNLAVVYLVSLHDLGKISGSFRQMINGQTYGGPRHWQHSYRLLLDHDARLAAILGGQKEAREHLYAAVAGHHGGPPEHLDGRAWNDQTDRIGAEANVAAGHVIDSLAALFPGASLQDMDGTTASRLSWRLCGLTVQADWIGSNPEWFGREAPDIPLETYWLRAKRKAERAIRAAGLFGATPAPDGAGGVLAGLSPRPLQQAVAEGALPDGPTLALIEDATGAGKTEAALILAARMMAAGKGAGLFFALPTMATSNAMLARLEKITPKLFTGKPSLALTHGKAGINDLFREIRGRSSDNQNDGASCSDWLAVDRRRVLLADIGVGTIDQALLAVLPTRFNALRLWALSRRILIVDEAHSYDPYMERELQRLLEFHAMLGGSAIVMTATLPTGMRDGFVRAFQRGRGSLPPEPRWSRVAPEPLIRETGYPLLSLVGQKVESRALDPVPATCRTVQVHRLTDTEAAVDTIVQGARNGAACVWVRNAVDDAIGAVEMLRDRGVGADLLHARFTVADRLHKERAMQARFGREGLNRAGRVLVATQVVEASLDLDFDLMVSDLAPIGSLIQRAGRLWRHMDLRPADLRPVDGPALHVLSPDPGLVEDDRWLHKVLDAGAWVYSQDVQWRTARVLFDAGAIRAPEGLRDLIETVHGDAPVEVPEPLENASQQYQGRMIGERQQASNNLLVADAPYDQTRMQQVWDDERFPTRLGEAQITMRLARFHDGGLLPWAAVAGGDWQMSEVQVSAARLRKFASVDQEGPEIRELKKGWPDWKKAQVVIAPVAQNGRICEGVRYDSELGLHFVAM